MYDFGNSCCGLWQVYGDEVMNDDGKSYLEEEILYCKCVYICTVNFGVCTIGEWMLSMKINVNIMERCWLRKENIVSIKNS